MKNISRQISKVLSSAGNLLLFSMASSQIVACAPPAKTTVDASKTFAIPSESVSAAIQSAEDACSLHRQSLASAIEVLPTDQLNGPVVNAAYRGTGVASLKDAEGNFVFLGTSPTARIELIENFEGNVTVCDADISTIRSTKANITVVNGSIDSLTDVDGNVVIAGGNAPSILRGHVNLFMEDQNGKQSGFSNSATMPTPPAPSPTPALPLPPPPPNPDPYTLIVPPFDFTLIGSDGPPATAWISTMKKYKIVSKSTLKPLKATGLSYSITTFPGYCALNIETDDTMTVLCEFPGFLSLEISNGSNYYEKQFSIVTPADLTSLFYVSVAPSTTQVRFSSLSVVKTASATLTFFKPPVLLPDTEFDVTVVEQSGTSCVANVMAAPMPDVIKSFTCTGTGTARFRTSIRWPSTGYNNFDERTVTFGM